MNKPFVSYCQHHHRHPKADAPALLMKAVNASYVNDERLALRNISLSVPRGASLALVGPNGAGKSTLFKVASSLLKLSSGEVEIFGQPLGACHQHVVYLPQRSSIDWQFPLSVLDLVLTGRYVYLGWFKNPSKEDYDRAWDSLKKLQVEDLAHRQIAQLSGGQQQRVLIARALTQDADLLLLDEPLNQVDVHTRQIVKDVLAYLKSQGKTTLVATHYFKQEERIYDWAVYLKDGEICSAES